MRLTQHSYLITLALLLLLTACSSVRPDTAAKYKQENVLGIDIHIPSPVQSGISQAYTATLTQDGQEVEHAEQVHFYFWNDEPAGESSYYHEEVLPSYEGDGRFRAEVSLPQDGTYFVQVTASSQGSTVMPTKRFTVGDVEPSNQTDQTPVHPSSHEGHH
ncbi:FixH family protein [Paenibacillus massiliensis]|uniref:FixH family protein n=1 Tax=Paenibacillus massiliensis TaxID=225917 RepID=UPI000470B1D1|nr:FixH family protein [Paenibacillus massiliensis]